MEGHENRKVWERYKTENCIGIITDDKIEKSTSLPKYEIVDINRRGALLRGDRLISGGKVLSLFEKRLDSEKENILIKNIACTCFSNEQRKDKVTNKEHLVALFTKEISPHDIARLNAITRATPKNNPRLWALMIADSKEVKAEIYHIERCRSDIFLAVVTAIFAATIAVGCLVVRDNVQQGALVLTNVVTFLMFLLGAYTTLEKGNALNMRQGFLSNLNDYVQLGQMPISYQGWSKIKHYFRDCGVLMRLKCCPIKNQEDIVSGCFNPPQNTTQESPYHACQIEGLEKAKEINLAKRFMPGLIDSFMSLCSYVYSILYVFSLVAFSYISLYLIDAFIKELLNYSGRINKIAGYEDLYLTTYPYLFFFIGMFVSMVFLMKFRKYVFKEGLVILLVLSFVSLFTKSNINENNYKYFSMTLAFLSGSFIGAIGGHLLNSLYVLRKGIRSPESYYHAWKKAIENCCTITDLNNPDLQYTPDKWRDRLVIRIQRFIYPTSE